jgi:hypothetical protein
MNMAYRQAHLQLATSIECVAQLDGLLLMMMRLPFGEKPCPAQWCTILEPICDLANELIHNVSWSPANLQSCYDLVLPEPDRTHSDTQFEETLPLVFRIPKNAVGAIDSYIDDLCSIYFDIDDNVERCVAAVAPALDVVGRPLDQQDTLPRHSLFSLKIYKWRAKKKK